MKMNPSLRKFTLTAHIVSSVGWLGTVVAFLALAVAGLSGQDAQKVRSAYLAMELIGWLVIVPCSLASLLTGLVQSLGTKWGLFRHYWIVVKFLLTVFSVLILFAFTRTLDDLGNLAANTSLSVDELHKSSQSPVLHSGGGLLVLLAATILSVYKPWGLTAYGRGKQRGGESELEHQTNGTPWGLYALIGFGVLALAFLVSHLAVGGFGQHGH
jgi:uncharacterized membrane protein